MVQDIYKATLAKVMVCVDGDDGRGGAVHYEGFWAFCTLYTCQVLLENGYFEQVRRYMKHFIKEKIDENGRFRMGRNYQIYDVGDFLQVLADSWWYTGDAELILEHLEPIERVIGYVKGIRGKSMASLKPGDPRYGMIEGIMNNDWANKPPGYFFTNDAPVWEGFREFSRALQEIGDAKKDKGLREKGDHLARYAQEYFEALRKSFQSAIEREGDRITYIHIRPVHDESAREAMRTQSKTNWRFRSHRRFHE
jgi:hypothetical protein